MCKLPQNSVKNCGPFCGPSCVHSGPLAPLRASDKNPETRTIKQNQLTSLNENSWPGDSRRLHHISFQTDLVGAMPCIARFMSRVQALQCSKKVKLRSARTFLKNGDRIKLTVALRGREIQHADLALALLNRFGVDLGDLATWNDEPKLDGKTAVMVLSPSR